jgi:hypothetical protein
MVIVKGAAVAGVVDLHTVLNVTCDVTEAVKVGDDGTPTTSMLTWICVRMTVVVGWVPGMVKSKLRCQT